MYEILDAKELAVNIYEFVVYAPRCAKRCLPGQFVIVRANEDSERIPLTISDYDREAGTVTIVEQIVGASSLAMSKLKKGDFFNDFAGPLGKPSELCEKSIDELKNLKILFVAGGLGTAPVYPQVKYLDSIGIKADVIIGSKTKDMLIYTDKTQMVAGNVYVTTDDGSFGRCGMVTKVIEDLYDNGQTYDLCICIGPMIMMKFVCLLTGKLSLKTIVSMNPIMVDGTGMCGACRLTVGNEIKFACVDGPEFDGHLVNFDEAMKRASIYKTAEGRAYLKAKEGDTFHGGCGYCGGDK